MQGSGHSPDCKPWTATHRPPGKRGATCDAARRGRCTGLRGHAPGQRGQYVCDVPARDDRDAARAKLEMLRRNARSEWRQVLRGAKGPAASRALCVLLTAEVTGLAPEWAYPAAAWAMLLPAMPAGVHSIDKSEHWGLLAAADWLEARSAPGAGRFRDYVRGVR